MIDPEFQRKHLETIAANVPLAPLTPRQRDLEMPVWEGRAVSCPRCEYDLAGQLATWARPVEQDRASGVEGRGSERALPEHGTCSECGLVFEWRLVLRPELAGWRWFIETAERSLMRAAAETSLRALAPWLFWRDVKLETPVSHVRIGLWLAITFGVLFSALAAATLAGSWTENVLATSTVVWTPPGAGAAGLGTRTAPSPYMYSAVTPGVVMTGALDDLRQTWLPRRMGFITGPPALLWAIGATVMAPVVLLVLPQTRARAKVRVRHIVRAAAYSLAWLVPFCVWGSCVRLVEVACDVVNLLKTVSPGGWAPSRTVLGGWSIMHGGFTPVAGFFIAVWLALYWLYVLGRGWRMDEQDVIPTTLSLAACCSLFGMVVMVFVG